MQADIQGTTMPILQLSLDQDEAVISTHGELAWMTPGITLSQTAITAGGGFKHGLRRIAGGGLLLTRYAGPGAITFTAKMPGRIVPIDIDGGHFYYVHRHGWLCGTPGITPSVGLQHDFRAGPYGGEGFVLHKLDGEGRAWIELSGELTSRDLQPGQTLLVHPGHVGMFQGTVQFEITRVPGIMSMSFGDDDLHVLALTGPGRVWLQSMPVPLLAHALQSYLDADERSAAAGGGAVGGVLGDMLRG